MEDLRVGDFSISANELQWRFSPSGGPGGQHANRSATRAELRFDPAASAAFGDDVKERIARRIGAGAVVVVVDESRSQWRNRQTARRRLGAMLEAAMKPDPPRRRPTRPSRSSRERRLRDKKARSETKRRRGTPGPDD
jgi:ribosome-associated protein